MYLIIVSILFLMCWFYFGYKSFVKYKDYEMYEFSLILKETAWNKWDDYFLLPAFCLSGLVIYYLLFPKHEYLINKMFNDKNSLKLFIYGWKSISNEDKAKRLSKQIENFEKNIEESFYKKYKIDICDYCTKQKECKLEHNKYDICQEFKFKV